MNEWAEVRAIDWSRLEGAYGPSLQVPAALEALRFGLNADDDTFSEAYLDVLYSHVWHRGSVYPVTPRVLPFVFDIVDGSPALAASPRERIEVATFVLVCARSARESNDAQLLAALEASGDRLETWARSEALRDIAIAVMSNVPGLATRFESFASRVKHEALLLAAVRLEALGVALRRQRREPAALDPLRERFGVAPVSRLD